MIGKSQIPECGSLPRHVGVQARNRLRVAVLARLNSRRTMTSPRSKVTRMSVRASHKFESNLGPRLLLLFFVLITIFRMSTAEAQPLRRRANHPAVTAPRACIPGVQVACACMGATVGIQVCNPAGTAMLPCECGPSTSMPAGRSTTPQPEMTNAGYATPAVRPRVEPNPPSTDINTHTYVNFSLGGGYGAGNSAGSHHDSDDFGPLLRARLGYTSQGGIAVGLVYIHGFGASASIYDPSTFSSINISSVWNAATADIGWENRAGILGFRASVGAGAAFHDVGCDACARYGVSTPNTKVAFMGNASIELLLRTRWVHFGAEARASVLASSNISISEDVIWQFIATGFAGISYY